MAEMKHLVGCIADDFTGASDAASFLQKAGLQTILLNGVPEQGLGMNEYDAIVIALKTRTEPAGEAVEHTMEAVKWLEQHGAAQYYLKYCSTFDSTKEGNIGPVLDAVLEYLEETYTVLCPSLPVNGRTVKDGHLYVNGVPLDESPMKDHPLTPMWDSRIKHLMEAQSKYKCIELNGEQLKEDNIDAYLLKEKEGQKHFYVIPDYETEEDAKRIVSLFGNKKVLSGGSGILQYLARGNKKGIVLAGSCSQATLTQIETYKKAGHSKVLYLLLHTLTNPFWPFVTSFLDFYSSSDVWSPEFLTDLNKFFLHHNESVYGHAAYSFAESLQFYTPNIDHMLSK